MIAVTRSGCFIGETETDRRAIVEDVKRIAVQPDRLDEAADDLGKRVEAVGERAARRRLGLSEAGQVGSDHTVAVGQRADQVAEHVARRREAMQQQDDGRFDGTGLSVEDVHVADTLGAIVGGGNAVSLGSRARAPAWTVVQVFWPPSTVKMVPVMCPRRGLPGKLRPPLFPPARHTARAGSGRAEAGRSSPSAGFMSVSVDPAGPGSR